ncbi:MAG: hypothetical protein KC620_18760, partial [Myxococcales bacterium]|nr:hypothetical protein [Myxococcales bacterium]
MRTLVGLALLLTATSAFAFDSQCWPGDIRRRTTVDQAACFEGVAQCGDGPDAARGTLYGEHTWLVRQAMLHAGLGPRVGDVALRYFTDRAPVQGDAEFTSIAPVGPTGPQVLIERPMTIAEFAQLPDWSYGMGDWMTGNETCPATNVLRGNLDRVKHCHSFQTHMGSVNSTHFLPQAQHIYARYHRLALAVAARCQTMANA